MHVHAKILKHHTLEDDITQAVNTDDLIRMMEIVRDNAPDLLATIKGIDMRVGLI